MYPDVVKSVFQFRVLGNHGVGQAASVSLRRIASADEIVGTALFLASDASSYLSGELLVLDGG